MTTATMQWGDRSDGRQEPLLPNAVFGMIVFVLTEAMFFSALISAFLVIRAGSGVAWALPPGVRLPVAATAFNSAILLASGVHWAVAVRWMRLGRSNDLVFAWMARAALLGAAFLVFQGLEWVSLLEHGLGMQGNIFGACFFLIIGSHAVHVAAALAALLVCVVRAKRGSLSLVHARAMRVLWLFVVGVWPALYGLVYF